MDLDFWVVLEEKNHSYSSITLLIFILGSFLRKKNAGLWPNECDTLSFGEGELIGII